MSELEALGITTLALDVCDSEAVTNVKERVKQLNDGRLDILVNNAGISYSVPSTDFKMPIVRRLFDVNLFGVMETCQVFIPLLRESHHPHGAKIINIGSVVGILNLPFGSAYNASKAALHAYGDTLRVELKPFNINVVTIVTGGVKSNMAVNNSYDIPDDSMYAGMKDLYLKLRKGNSQRDAMPTADYAAKVVNRTLKQSPAPWLWIGSFAFTIRVINALGWTRVWDYILARRFGLDVFAARLRGKRS